VVLVPGMGDDVQTFKAGIMEIADIFVINKADQPGADRVERELEAMLSVSVGSKPAIVKTVATTGEGVAELLEIVSHHAPARKSFTAAPAIDHLGIGVESLEQAIAFYQSLGLAVSQREEHAAVLPAGDARIELTEAAPPGLHHIALRVPDLRAAAARLEAAGARLSDSSSAGGRCSVFVHPASAGGVLLELIEESGAEA
jgi:LAO/AO transport system kinase